MAPLPARLQGDSLHRPLEHRRIGPTGEDRPPSGSLLPAFHLSHNGSPEFAGRTGWIGENERPAARMAPPRHGARSVMGFPNVVRTDTADRARCRRPSARLNALHFWEGFWMKDRTGPAMLFEAPGAGRESALGEGTMARGTTEDLARFHSGDRIQPGVTCERRRLLRRRALWGFLKVDFARRSPPSLRAPPRTGAMVLVQRLE